MFWYWLRLSRFGPYGNAGDDPFQAGIYRAALQQFEDLMKAAEATGPAGRPLPLFYALSQAGRAIVASRGGGTHIGHGMKIDAPSEELLETMVRPTVRQTGQFQLVANALGSTIVAQPVALGALMASLPELSDELLLEMTWPRPLAIFVDDSAPFRDPVWAPLLVVVQGEVSTAEDFESMLTRYPRGEHNPGPRKKPLCLSMTAERVPNTPTHLGSRRRTLPRASVITVTGSAPVWAG